jgi:hypothetical protein
VFHCGSAQAEGEPRPGNHTPPVGAVVVSSAIASRCVATRVAVVVPSVPVESTDRSVDGVEVLKGPQRPLGRAPGHQQRARWGPVLAWLAAASEICCGW